MYRLGAVIAVGLMTLVLVGCGSSSQTDHESPPEGAKLTAGQRASAQAIAAGVLIADRLVRLLEQSAADLESGDFMSNADLAKMNKLAARLDGPMSEHVSVGGTVDLLETYWRDARQALDAIFDGLSVMLSDRSSASESGVSTSIAAYRARAAMMKKELRRLGIKSTPKAAAPSTPASSQTDAPAGGWPVVLAGEYSTTQNGHELRLTIRPDSGRAEILQYAGNEDGAFDSSYVFSQNALKANAFLTTNGVRSEAAGLKRTYKRLGGESDADVQAVEIVRHFVHIPLSSLRSYPGRNHRCDSPTAHGPTSSAL